MTDEAQGYITVCVAERVRTVARLAAPKPAEPISIEGIERAYADPGRREIVERTVTERRFLWARYGEAGQ